MATLQRNTELRKLPAASLYNLAVILDTHQDWQKIVSLIPMDFQSKHFERKYNSEDIRIMEEHATSTNKKFAEVLFDEWGTSGKVRPNLGNLMELLCKAQLMKAADDIARLLGESTPERPPNCPAAPITINLTELQNDISVEQRLNSMTSIQSDNLQDSSQDQAMCNDITRQIKDPSNLIDFSTTVYSKDIPDLPAPLGYDNKSTAIVGSTKLVSDSKTLTSGQFPDFKALGIHASQSGNSLSFETKEYDSKTAYSFIPATITSEIYSSRATTTHQSEFSQHGAGGSLASGPSSIFNIIDKAILEDKKLVHFDHRELEVITNKFCETFIDDPAGPVGKIGSGGFGEVYVGKHRKYGTLAIKRGRIQSEISYEIAIKVFNTEVKSLSLLRHENIVPILGYSIDGTPCIVCKYIDGGSLQQKIAAKILTESERIKIMRGTAEGLKYIHHTERPPQFDVSGNQSESISTGKSYFLHGDVKSANILLTKDCVPKLCDFGLAKQLEATFITTKPMGTSAYMPPEGFNGTVTQKNDIFSFGIVLLELLTGLKPITKYNGNNINIKNYVDDNCLNDDIDKILDNVVKHWTTSRSVFKLAQWCLEYDKNKRPSIDEVCEFLKGIYSSW